MLSIDVLNQLLGDRELREQASRLITNKLKADMQSLQSSAELSRYLLETKKETTGDGKEAARQLIKEHLDHYETLVNLTLAFNQRLLDKLRRSPATGAQEAPRHSATMRIEAPLHATVRAPFRLENSRSTPVTVKFQVTPFVSEDGGQLVSARTVFDPPAVELKPGQETKIDFILPVMEGFVAGTTYLATISVAGLESMQIIVKLRVIEPPAAESATEAPQAPAAGSASVAEEAPATPAPKRAPRKKTAAKKSPRRRAAK